MSATATLTCGCCGADCNRLHDWTYCDSCWYTVCGGDLAPDDFLTWDVSATLNLPGGEV